MKWLLKNRGCPLSFLTSCWLEYRQNGKSCSTSWVHERSQKWQLCPVKPQDGTSLAPYYHVDAKLPLDCLSTWKRNDLFFCFEFCFILAYFSVMQCIFMGKVFTFFIHFSKRLLMLRYLLTYWLKGYIEPNRTDSGK